MYCFFGAASGWGAQILGTQDGPQAVWKSSLRQQLASHHIRAVWQDIVYTKKRVFEEKIPLSEDRLPLIADHCAFMADQIRGKVNQGCFPVVVGGDHAVAVGTWSGVTSALNASGNFGLLWIDAHMDAHTPSTSPSHAYHGMPLACLLGKGPSSLIHVLSKQPKIRPEHLVLFGIRSFEQGEHDFLTGLGVRIFYMQEIKSRGLDVCLGEALSLITKKVNRFGVSMDLDAFDPTVAPGVGSPEEDGFFPQDLLPHLEQIWRHPSFSALELVELNPHLDPDQKTLHLAENILLQAISTHHGSLSIAS